MKALSCIALTALLVPLAGIPAQAQVASLVRDITPQSPLAEDRAANPAVLSAAGNRLVFAADDDVHGNELWASDGTAGGTKILEDACPGECGSIARLVATTKTLSFWAFDSPGALWRSDGTRAGTFPVADSILSNETTTWAVRGDVLFFSRCAPPGCALWRTDGTLAGTREVLDLDVRFLAVAGNRVLAATADELWRIDPGGETPVRVASPGQADFLAVVQDRLLMIVSVAGGQDLWSTDGTAAGTRALTQFANTYPFGFERNVAATSRRLYFVADDIEHGNELWASDGTPQGTKRISDFGYYFPFQSPLSLTLQEAGERVVFAATDGLSEETLQLWSTDGRPESTIQLLEPCPRECSGADSPVPYRTARAGNAVLFPAVDTEHGIELWTTDGTPAGTRLFRDFCPGDCDSAPILIPPGPGTAGVYLAAQNHLWWTDGTAAGTLRLTRRPLAPYDLLTPQVASVGGKTYVKLGDDYGGHLGLLKDGEILGLTFGSAQGYGSEIQSLVPEGGLLHFLIDGPREYGLWQTGGTAETTRSVTRDLDSIERPVTAGGIVYFFRRDDELWRFTGDGALKIADITDGSHYGVGSAAALGAYLYFNVNRDGGWEIWKTDGTAAGTTSFLTLPAGLNAGFVAASGGRLYFGLYEEGGQSARLWASDGTAAGTREILALADYQYAGDRFVRAGGNDYFVTYGYQEVARLWRTDGTAAGTLQIPLGTEPVRIPGGMIAHQGSLYVLGEDFDYPYGTPVLWRIDGDTVVRLRTFAKDVSSQLELASVGGLVLLSVDDGEHGQELWATDGTAAGTRLVRDIAPGSFSAQVSGLTAAGGRVFFTARDNTHGVELWQSDGTTAGTRLVHDLNPGPASSRPEQLTAADGRLYFTADDGLVGRELWTLPLAGPAACQPSGRVLCLQGNRFQVEASWRDFQLNAGAGTAVSVTGDTGYFWFFNPANAEVILKVLDGRSLNDHFWVFYGALSSVEYTMTVTDTQTGLTTRYINPSGQLASVGDTTAFGPAGAFSSKSRIKTAPPSPPALIRAWTAAAAACEAGPQRLCLNGGRFAVEASWKDFAGKTGKGTAVPLSGETGYFWFFNPSNVEVLLKVLDGTPVNGKFWFFYGALSNVEYTITVTDTQTGTTKEYRNPSGRFASVADTGAF